MRRLGRRFSGIGEERAEHWQRRVESLWRGVLIVFVGASMLWLGYMVLYVINWSPLWMRAYSACNARQPEADTVAEMFRHKQECVDFASKIVEQSSK